ncbi:MAG TPA: hypothetical protein VFA66_13750 [Gaiellaceae bacterium]|nr:hypothetical protein [Gaiellaceae bacterium]
MPEFLIELYVPRADTAAVERRAARARVAAEELSREGTPVRYLRSVFVPEDETCFLLWESARVEDVVEAARRASLRFERAVPAVIGEREEES